MTLCGCMSMLSSSAERRETVQDCQGQTKEGVYCYFNRFVSRAFRLAYVSHFIMYIPVGSECA